MRMIILFFNMFITTGSLFIAGFIKENDQIGNFDIISSKVVRWI